MTNRVLIVGGRGRIGNSVAQDIVTHTDAEITITGRDPNGSLPPELPPDRSRYLALDLADSAALQQAVSSSSLVVHCAGPFHYRDASVLKTCIEAGVNYADVSDSRSFTRRALEYRETANKSGVTAIINTGIFPGVSNSMVRRDIEKLDTAEQVHLSYVVGGSGGAGVTVMRTTFLGLQTPFEALIDGKMQQINPYTDRETIEFPEPYGKTGVYWFDMPEAITLPETFPVKTVVTKFGTSPDLYNHLTWFVAKYWPDSWLKNPSVIEFLSYVSYGMTAVSNNFSGVGVAVRSQVTGIKNGKPAKVRSTAVHPNAATATGIGTGSIAQLMLEGKLAKPGVWSVEQALSTELFEGAMQSRNLNIEQVCV
ncbi:saccharopine dehydrogenase NADP-binding domain-containing protein [Tychonema sp. LEGE 07199]|uniref:saccharopine dehydrogenase family protein n=1 Tax=unclassified Tychonema TaxID=2642144 RepID=UPI0018809298|nr:MULTISPECIES: saccharopine dehydrogenase NADP-binding domain-containing protein [unclassified Tychonema]MBE9124322.1 saccharopine dehydrogenase NADP-binding domain-containing protein [Tychonema sp. LEGE 07199]MBE9132313.1 saccharopine dehydrogenase NADP-binding domain-containing protein [Tychonema sp. LEGE 07196]